MKSALLKERRAQIDRALTLARENHPPPTPKDGWIKSIREALGMSLQEFADRLNISKTAAFHIEKSEANDRITLARLRSAAAALNCEVQVVFVPKSSLSQAAEAQAMKQAQELVRRASHTMALEGQANYTTSDEELVKETAQEILAEGRIRWD